ncbi:MAG: signal recognition particle protein [Ureaplasma sp.]|nr:signal recognition particle protein [Ureaplasma sp.]
MLKSMIANIVAKRMTKKLRNATITEEDIADLLREIRISLLDADVNLFVVKDFIKSIKEKTVGQMIDPRIKPSDFVLNIIKEELIRILGQNAQHININKKQVRIMLVGLQGSGKTTTCGKIANFYKNKNAKKPMLVGVDIYRAAAIEQLRKIASDLHIDFYEHGTQDPRKTVEEALEKADEQNNDLIVLDTAGRLQTNEELMQELLDLKKEFQPDEILLVVDGMSGQDIVNVAKEFNEWLKLTGLIITKLDSDAKAGAALSLTSILNTPIKFTGSGEKLGSLDLFYPERMADRILGLGDILTLAEKSLDEADEKQMRGTMQRMFTGKFDLEDLMKNIERMAKMGSMSSLVGMLPGQKINESQIQEAQEKMDSWKVLLSSMTLKERRDPRLFKKQPNRKVRVVKGAGKSMDELNKLLKRWEESRDKMHEMGKMLQKGQNPFKGMF